MSHPSPDEKAFRNFADQGVGCLGTKKVTRIELGQYVGKPPPKQLVSATGWSFLNTGHAAGFVAFGNSSTRAEASFNLSCGHMRHLDLEYLLSYEGMGAVSVAVTSNEIGPTMVIDGLWESRASVPWFRTVPIPGDSKSVLVTLSIMSAENEEDKKPSLSNSDMNKPSLRGDRKFKLISMQCC